MEDLPTEVLSEIFIRLLAKQLAQIRCICKSWNALLSESSFIRSHLHRSIHNNDEILLFFRQYLSSYCSSITARLSHSPDLELTNFIKPPVNPQSKFIYGNVIGSVNGLICFYYNGSYHHDYAVNIWNPSLSAMLTLPWCSPSSCELRFGFGFDPKTDDYKVVKLRSFSPINNMVLQAEVYSMRKNSWESISQRFPSHITSLRWQNQVCVDGHFHWFCDTNLKWKPETILAFDFGAETFRETPLPDSILHQHNYRFRVLGVFAGKLCVINIEGGECEAWVMNENGVAGSWVKHHAFSQFRGDIIPYGFTSHSEFLFRSNDGIGHFGLYDSVAAKTKSFKIRLGEFYARNVIEYVDSLVWIAPGNQLQI